MPEATQARDEGESLVRYAEATRALQYERLGTLYLMAVLLSLAYLLPDTLLFGRSEAWPTLLACRLGIAAAALGGIALNRLRLVGVSLTHPLRVGFVVTAILVVTLALITNGAGGFLSPYFAASDMLFLVWCFVLVGGARALALPALGLLALFLALLLLLRPPALPSPAEMAGAITVVFIAMGVCLAGSEVIETLRRKEFERRTELAEQNRLLQRALEESERIRGKLVRTESLATLGEYIAAIMHELRNPIAGVASVIEEVVAELKTEGDAQVAGPIEGLECSLQQQRRAGAFVSSLMDLSRRSDAYEEPVDVGAVIEDALALLRVQFKDEAVAFEYEADASLPPVRGNFAQLGQVLLNLGRNAGEALAGRSASGSTGGSTSGPTSGLNGWVRFAARPAEGFVEIVCEDSGPGIAEQALPNLFGAFSTTKRAGEGAGLGLFLAQQVVARHGGTIAAANAPGGGARFTIRIPAAK